MAMLKGSENPNDVLLKMSSNNPQIKQVMDLIAKSGNDPKKTFYDMCNQKGIDPNEIISMLNS